MEHDNRTFPAVEYEGQFLAETYLHDHDNLPHLQANLDALFPRAVASEEEREAEDVTPCTFESRGEALGKASCVVKATTPTTTTTTTPTTATTTTTKTDDNGGHLRGEESKKVTFGKSEEVYPRSG